MIRLDIDQRLGDFRLQAKIDCPEPVRLLALFGRSGCGKTSLINAVAGLSRPDHGWIDIGGDILFESGTGVDIPPERRRIGYVFQEGRLFPHLSIRRNLTYGMRRAGGPAAITFDHAVALLGLEPLLERKPGRLSGGERQRVAIGRALLAHPRMLLMDEPLASLDAARKDEILPFIERLRDEANVPIIYVSHAMEEVARLADRVALMDDGRVAALDSIEALTSRLDLRPLTGRYEAGTVFPVTVEAQDETYGLTRLRCTGGMLTVPRLDLPVGHGFRVRIRARDVILSLSEPAAISPLNRLQGTVRELAAETDGPMVDVLLDVGVPLWSRITRRSADNLDLAPGKPVWALVKTVSIDRASLGRTK